MDYPPRVIQRVSTRITVTDAGCWESTFGRSNGYAIVNWNDEEGIHRVERAHRIAWSAANGCPVPTDKVIDHICFNRACVRPEHLRLLSWVENIQRTSKPVGRKPTVPITEGLVCPNCAGPMVTYTSGRIRCRPCFNAKQREARRV